MEAPFEPNDTVSSVYAKRYYQSCMNVTALEKLGGQSLLAILKDYGGMPVLEGQNWTETGYDWMENNAKLFHDMHLSPIVHMGIGPDEKNSSVKMLQVKCFFAGF